MIRLNVDIPDGFKATGEYRYPLSFEYYLRHGQAVRCGLVGGFDEHIILVPKKKARKKQA